MTLSRNKIERIMAEKKLSQKDIADLIDVGTSTVSGYFKNADRVRNKTIGRLADALQVDIDEIIE